MPSVTYTSKKGMKQLGTEVLTALANTKAYTLTDTSRLVGGSWSGVNATIVDTGDIEVTSTAAGGYATRTITGLTIGNTYILVCNLIVTSGGNGTLRALGTDIDVSETLSSGVLSITIVADATTLEIRLENAAIGVNDFTNIIVEDGILDYSTSSNGLQVTGSVIASEVATGSELIGFSNFSNSNYIRQDYINTELNYEQTDTQDFYYVGWVKLSTTVTSGTIFAREFTSGSRMLLDISSTSLRFRVSDDFANFDTAEYTSGISDNKWHFIACIYRTVFKDTGSEKAVMELWVDTSLVATINVTNATNILINNNARLTFGNNYVANDALTNGALAMWKSAPYAPLYAEIDTIYQNEKTMFKPYTIFRSYGEIYNLDIRYTNLDRSYDMPQARERSIGRKQVSTVSNDGQTWSITTIPLNKDNTQLDTYTHLLDSVLDGSLLTFDARGSISDPYDPVNAYLVETSYQEARHAKTEYYSLSFSFIEL